MAQRMTLVVPKIRRGHMAGSKTDQAIEKRSRKVHPDSRARAYKQMMD